MVYIVEYANIFEIFTDYRSAEVFCGENMIPGDCIYEDIA